MPLSTRARLASRPLNHVLFAPSLLVLTICGAGSTFIYLLAFTLPYSFERGLARPLLHFGRITGPSLWPTVGYVAAICALLALYLVALRASRELEGRWTAYVVLIAFSTLSALVLLQMYPVFSLDIFYYMAADRIWSVYRENPFVVPPLQAAHDPFFPYTTWGHYPLPYGPLWPWITALTSASTRGDLYETLTAFKGLAVLGYLACLPAIAWAVRGLRPTRAVTGLCLFAWNPLVLLELPGGGHNDAIALIPAIIGVGMWVRRKSFGAAVALAASFLVKATVTVMAPALLWASLWRAYRSRRLAWWIAGHVALTGALVVLGWLPFLSGRHAEGLVREAEQYYQSVTAVVVATVPSAWKGFVLRGLQALLVTGFIAYGITQRNALREEGVAALRSVWRIQIMYFMLVSPFYSGWYIVWPVMLAAVVVERRTTLLTTLLCVGSFGTYLVQFVARPLWGAEIGWALVNLLGIMAAFGPFLGGWWLLYGRSELRPRIASALRLQPAPQRVKLGDSE